MQILSNNEIKILKSVIITIIENGIENSYDENGEKNEIGMGDMTDIHDAADDYVKEFLNKIGHTED